METPVSKGERRREIHALQALGVLHPSRKALEAKTGKFSLKGVFLTKPMCQ
jgi:hypothetical protein